MLELPVKMAGLRSSIVEDTSILECRMCQRRERTNPVFYTGKFGEKWVFQGSAPSKYERDHEVLFPPQSSGGKMFMRYLRCLGLDRDEVYITNTCFCTGSKLTQIPTVRESSICSRWKGLEWSCLVESKYVVLMGNDAIRQYFGYDFPSVVYRNGLRIKSSIMGRELVFLLVHHPGHIYQNVRLTAETLGKLTEFGRFVSKEGGCYGRE